MSISLSLETYGPKTVIGARMILPISEFSNQGEAFDETLQELYNFLDEQNIEILGPSCFVYEQWDEEEDEAVVTIGVVVDPKTIPEGELEDYEVIDILEGGAAIATIVGDYSQMEQAHAKLVDFMEHQGEERAVTHFIEEYETIEEDEKKNVTKVIYVLEDPGLE